MTSGSMSAMVMMLNIEYQSVTRKIGRSNSNFTAYDDLTLLIRRVNGDVVLHLYFNKQMAKWN